MRGMAHPHVLRILDADMTAKEPYYVAEFCSAGSLADQGRRFERNIADAVLVVLTPIVDALRAAHAAGVVHRDVKPPNILFREDGTVVLGDFGICHGEGDDRVTLSEEGMGSTNYIAPEMQAGQRGQVTGAADVYAIGKVFYWMLSGGKIFAREAHRAQNVYLPTLLGNQAWEHVHSLFDQMIIEDPSARISIQLLPDALKQCVDLIEGEYMPLRPSMGLRCRVCGMGTYRKFATTANRGAAGWMDQLNVAGTDLRLLRCNHCGHIEWFDFREIGDREWWDR